MASRIAGITVEIGGDTTKLQTALKTVNSSIKEKLETLRAASEQANEALAKGEISKDQYDALQREIEEIEQNLKRLEDQSLKSIISRCI